MIGTSVGEYVFIRIAIFALRCITPLACIYWIVLLIGSPLLLPHRWPLPLEIWLGAEALFYLCFYVPLSIYLQSEVELPTLPSRDERRSFVKKCAQNIPNPEEYLRKWFLMAPTSEIKRENLREFLSWALLGKKENQLTRDDDEEISEAIRETEKILGRNLETGWGNAKCIRLSFDPVVMHHRPLVYYLVCVPTLSIVQDFH
jgi:hypothetical protein